MSDVLPILSGIKLEMQTMNKSLLKMTKTHVQVLSEEWITKEQVLAVLKISPRTLETLKGSGKLPFSKINSLIYYRTADLEDLLKKNYVNPSPSAPSFTLNHNNDECK